MTLALAVFGGGKDSAISANAASFPTGDFDYKPEIECLDDYDWSNIPESSSDNDSPILNSSNQKNEILPLNNSSTGDHYKKLNDFEKSLYNALYYIVNKGLYIKYNQKETDELLYANRYTFMTGQNQELQQRYSEDEMGYFYNRACEACYFDHPDIVDLYMCYPRGYGSVYDGTKYEYYLIFKANYDETKFATINHQIKQGLAARVAEIKANGLVTSEKAATELNIYDYYADSLEYDYACASTIGNAGYFNLSHTAWGSLYKYKAVCDGYSAGYEMILEELGIDTMIIAGVGNGGGHAWNIVNLDGDWYEVDTTWALPQGSTELNHVYFNRTTEEFAAGLAPSDNSYPITHLRPNNGSYCGFRMQEAKGTKYTYNFICSNYGSQLKSYKHIAVSGIGISQPSYNLKVGESITIQPNIYPADASNKECTVTSNAPLIASVADNKVTGVSAGTAIITFTTIDGGFEASCFVYVAGAAPGSEISASGATYKVNDEDSVTLINGAGKNTSTYSIPATVVIDSKTYKVTTIKSGAFKNNKKLTTLKGGANLTSIGNEAFMGCKKLKNVKLASSKIKSIGTKAFYGCTKLGKVELNGNYLKTVGSKAFKGTKKGVVFRIKASKVKIFNKITKKLKKSGCKNATSVRTK